MPSNATSESNPVLQPGSKLPSPSAKGGFVVNLAASTTPVTLVQPTHEALRGYTFFVSRRREDGRERFRLHMGYFESQHDAELMLDAVREIFPAAWAGVAPGRKLAAEAAGVKAVAPAALDVPQVHVAASTPEPVMPTFVAPPPPSATAASAPAAARPAVVAPRTTHQAASDSLNSVRAAIASLDDESRFALEAKQRASATAAEMKLLSDTQTMRLLESRKLQEQADKEARKSTPPVGNFAGFVVQLRWSTRPIDISQLPAMAIFDAYTLYSAEGSNGPQQWYGLRLGFFNDGDSAKQVANYVRSEFPSVSVVPIGADERNGAQQAVRGTAAAKPARPAVSTSGEFRLIDDPKAAAAAPPASEPPTVQAATAAKPKSKGDKPARPAGERRAPLTIEETLEILGANSLKLEGKKPGGLSGKDSEAMLRAARRKSPQKSKLGQLFEKLATRV
jgi:hypothetical protein